MRQTSPDPQLIASSGWVPQSHKEGVGGVGGVQLVEIITLLKEAAIGNCDLVKREKDFIHLEGKDLR